MVKLFEDVGDMVSAWRLLVRSFSLNPDSYGTWTELAEDVVAHHGDVKRAAISGGHLCPQCEDTFFAEAVQYAKDIGAFPYCSDTCKTGADANKPPGKTAKQLLFTERVEKLERQLNIQFDDVYQKLNNLTTTVNRLNEKHEQHTHDIQYVTLSAWQTLCENLHGIYNRLDVLET